MNEFKVDEEFGRKSYSLQSMDKKKLQEIAADLGYKIDYAWHPLYSEIFGVSKSNPKNTFFQESLILHDLNNEGPIYEKFLTEERENPEFKKKAKMDYEELKKNGETDESIMNSHQDDALDYWHDGELNKIADKKMFKRYGGVIFYNKEQEKEYEKMMEWGYDYFAERNILHLKTINSNKPKVLLFLDHKNFGYNSQKINETQWKKYLNIMQKKLEKS